MGFMQFLGQVKQGKGMAALSREADRLGVKKVENMARIGVTIGKALGIRGMDSVERGLNTIDKAKETATNIGNTLEAAQNAAKSGSLVEAATQARSAFNQCRAATKSAIGLAKSLRGG